MKLVALSLCAFLAWPALAADGLAECAGIESAVERLDCYDRLASQQAHKPAREEAGQPEVAPSAPQTSERPAQRAQGDIEDQPQLRQARSEEEHVAQFGKPQQRDPAQEFEAVEARIESVRKAPLGQQIMTLSNGQIWMENEPGPRRIEPDQPVTIRKHRLHYEMELASQPNVTVRRVD